ncbi:unnamed protein product, partial [Closterium sp. NIES-53]
MPHPLLFLQIPQAPTHPTRPHPPECHRGVLYIHHTNLLHHACTPSHAPPIHPHRTPPHPTASHRPPVPPRSALHRRRQSAGRRAGGAAVRPTTPRSCPYRPIPPHPAPSRPIPPHPASSRPIPPHPAPSRPIPPHPAPSRPIPPHPIPSVPPECHRGVLYIDDANLLDDALAALLFAALAEGCSAVEREGLSVRHACRPLLLASFNPQEGALRRHLLDRIALIVSTDAPLSLEQRVAAADVANAFLDGRLTAGGRARGNVGPEGQTLLEEEKGEEGEEEEESVEEGVEADRLRVLFARQLLPRVSISQAQIAFLVDAAVQLECEGQRAELFAVRAAKALAALNGRAQVTQADLVRAAQLAIVPRATVALASEPSSSPPQSARAAPPPPSRRAEDSKEEPQEEQEGEPPEVDEEQLVPASFVVEAEDTRLDAAALQLFQRAARTAGRAGRSKNKIYSEERGRYVKALLPKGKVVRLAVDATLRAAAPLQRVRRERAARTGGRERRIYVDKSDLRRKLLARRASSLVVFIVDASGSMALNRMGAAKGAALQLLAESYSKRDSIAVVPFHDQHADLLVPPSRAVALAHKRLESLPCGGGSPLAHALVVAVRAAEVARRRGDVGQVVAVLITDGRANVPLSTSLEAMEGGGGGGEGATGAGGEEKLPPRLEDIKEEVLSIAAKMGAAGIQLLVIDTENKFVSSGFAKEIAKHSQ